MAFSTVDKPVLPAGPTTFSPHILFIRGLGFLAVIFGKLSSEHLVMIPAKQNPELKSQLAKVIYFGGCGSGAEGGTNQLQTPSLPPAPALKLSLEARAQGSDTVMETDIL